jgi:hypothetical protein
MFMAESSPTDRRGDPRRIQIDTTENRTETLMGQRLPANLGYRGKTPGLP